MIDCVFLGDWGTLPDNRLCHHEKIHAGDAGVPERFCAKCPLRQPHEPGQSAQPLLRRSPRFRLTHACVHLGGPTGETRDCGLCGGRQKIPLATCALHNRCTTENHLAYRSDDGTWVQVAFCLSCKDYEPREE